MQGKKSYQKLAGFRDFSSKGAYLKLELIKRLRGVFESYGFLPIETPHLEYAKVLISQVDEKADGAEGADGTEADKQIYRFFDHGKRDVALRFDHTLPLARYVAQYFYDIPIPFKRYVVGNVFRGESPQAGRYREFTQCDFDFVGINKPEVDAEVLQVIYHSLMALGIKDFVIKINHRYLLDCLIKKLGIIEKKSKLLQITDKLDKIGHEKVLEQLISLEVLKIAEAKRWLSFIEQKIDNPASLKSLVKDSFGDVEGLDEVYNDIERVYSILDAVGIDDSKYIIDLKVVRGLDYYTGMVYETFLGGDKKLGAICSGGRYDNLIGKFSGQELSGAGASIGLDRLLSFVEHDVLAHKIKAPCQLLIAILDDESLLFAYKWADDIRKKGINVEVYPKRAKLAKQFKYAQKKKFLYLLACGENEREGGEPVLADLNTGEKIKFSDIKALVDGLQGRLDELER
ncbi:MAG: histidine--tRNA ligase [SAR324 cluster bacterium]|nr:histidine--tRNA ligase [SAR324 cluster bacterium]